MQNVVSFAAYRDNRRAEAAIKEAAAKAADLLAKEIDQLADKLGGDLVAECLASALVQAAEADKPAQFVPAYCDPRNETRGSKFEATRGLPLADIAARIRADIKAAQKSGAVCAGAKISVRTSTYSGGGSIEVRVTALPADFRILAVPYAAWRRQFGDTGDAPFNVSDRWSADARALLDALRDIHGAYNRDNSDGMSDYFDRRYYGGVEIDWTARRDMEAAEIEAAPADYWAENANRA